MSCVRRARETSCDVDKLVGKVDSAGNTAARGNALFQSKCDAGDAMACGLLGENLLAGIGIGVDRERGMTLLKVSRRPLGIQARARPMLPHSVGSWSSCLARRPAQATVNL